MKVSLFDHAITAPELTRSTPAAAPLRPQRSPTHERINQADRAETAVRQRYATRATVLASARVESPSYLLKPRRWAIAAWLLSHLQALHDSGVRALARCGARQDTIALPPQQQFLPRRCARATVGLRLAARLAKRERVSVGWVQH